MTRKTVAVTGGIGSGKSEVSKILLKRGYDVISCDVLAREVADSKDVIDRVRTLLGEKCVTDGKINRKAVREKAFASKSLLNSYNAIFFGKIKELLDERLAKKTGTVFVEIPLFYAFEYKWDAVWLVYADEEMRIERAALRDNATKNDVKRIAESQRICDKYDFKINNCGDLDELAQEVDKALSSL